MQRKVLRKTGNFAHQNRKSGIRIPDSTRTPTDAHWKDLRSRLACHVDAPAKWRSEQMTPCNKSYAWHRYCKTGARDSCGRKQPYAITCPCTARRSCPEKPAVIFTSSEYMIADARADDECHRASATVPRKEASEPNMLCTVTPCPIVIKRSAGGSRLLRKRRPSKTCSETPA